MSPSLRRLMKEATELTNSPSPHFHAHPVSDSNLYDWHFTIAGPPAPSPYASGIYHGRIVLPPTYPLRPPSFRFLTPSGRFEVNREICLSISGHHEETWQPAWGIRTSLLAIRSFMDGDAKGQVGGLDVSEEVRRDHAEKSRGWVCEGCGKSNEAILSEWREFCREKGVEVGEMGDERVVPREAAKEDTQDKEEEPVEESVSAEPAQQQPPPTVQPTPALALTAATHPQVPAPASRPPVAPQPTQAVASRQSDDPWLDRAIIGVLIALVFMILRRVVNWED
ncbi:ubiquitin-conjugating enzyme/RWD-like protein [Aspergillus avenaceus]|uniref:Ubiquitin-conjugating enzyme/RWD-like protein n=1 Tax=Aspergillus avenaceus TaxID=36643 RepID=A0A5N6TWR5_ASPAV|nr:ubiquitin-conjugating enzyme/RWD-like protein [Aspergillus avenaceus]